MRERGETPYFKALCDAMGMISRHPKSVFVGQGVGCAGTFMSDTLRGVPREKLLEFPVAEDLQAGFCTGLALEGWVPVCIFPRWNFALLAANQIVNHLDKLPLYSGYRPKVIIRTAAPSVWPLDPGPQHSGNFTYAFAMMLDTIKTTYLDSPDGVMEYYSAALLSDTSCLLVEEMAQYGWDHPPSGVREQDTQNVVSIAGLREPVR